MIAINDPNVRATLGTATLATVGSDALAGNLNWGRWAGAGSTIQTGPVGDLTDRNCDPLHYLYGNAATNRGGCLAIQGTSFDGFLVGYTDWASGSAIASTCPQLLGITSEA